MNPWLIVELWSEVKSSIGITFVDILQNWLNWFHFLFLKGGVLVVLMSPFLDLTRMSMSTVSFLTLPIECFHLTYNLSDLKSRINRHLLTVGSF